MQKLKILTIFGTRPEVIKLAPFIKAIESDSECISITCATTQHRELQNDILNVFKIKPNYDLDIMIKDQDLFYITNTLLDKIKKVLENENPDFIVVQGDTTTAFVAALAGFYKKISIVHLEAGLRTWNIYSPYPEEANRSIISRITTLHMAPTLQAVSNLNNEGIIKNIFMVGNTIVDSVYWVLEHCQIHSEFIKEQIKSCQTKILITVHRRENFGEPFINICSAIKDLCKMYPGCVFIWPIHPNPNIKSVIFQYLINIKNLYLIEPLLYPDLLSLINSCSLILSDSGGIQEEAYILSKRVIILREETERPEVVEAGFGVLVGSSKEKILYFFTKLMQDTDFGYKKNKQLLHKDYGQLGVSNRILAIIKKYQIEVS